MSPSAANRAWHRLRCVNFIILLPVYLCSPSPPPPPPFLFSLLTLPPSQASLNDKPRAYAIAWQSVVDGLKVTAANPSFLDTRDAIVDAIEDLHAGGLITEDEHRKTRQAFWKAFAHFEMGNNATSQGASLIGIVGDDTLPPRWRPRSRSEPR